MSVALTTVAASSSNDAEVVQDVLLATRDQAVRTLFVVLCGVVPEMTEHRGLDHKGVMRDCIQEIHFCAFPFDPESLGVLVGDCVEVMRGMEPDSIDAIVTDPPYGLEFMGKEWDRLSGDWNDGDPAIGGHPTGGLERWTIKRPRYHAGVNMQAWHEAWATEALRVLKPGGHLLAFGGPRTYHRLACGVEDAGFEIRDCLMWLFGSGFPKSLDVGKAIDRRAEVNVDTQRRITAVAAVIKQHREAAGMTPQEVSVGVVGTPSGACWNWEHIQLPSLEKWRALKALLAIPDRFDALIEGDRSRFIAAEREAVGYNGRSAGWFASADGHDITAPATDLARKWDGWGTALKPAYEPCIVARKPLAGTVAANVERYGTGALNIDACRIPSDEQPSGSGRRDSWRELEGREDRQAWNGGNLTPAAGRWPANVALDEEAARLLDEQSGERPSPKSHSHSDRWPGWGMGDVEFQEGYGDTGGASRFYYTAKASRSEREAWGRLTLPPERRTDGREKDIENPRLRTSERINTHPCVKPLALMEWLITLVLPPGGLLLDPFCGSGSTLVAARRLNVRAIGIEKDERSAEIARQRTEVQYEVRLL